MQTLYNSKFRLLFELNKFQKFMQLTTNLDYFIQANYPLTTCKRMAKLDM